MVGSTYRGPNQAIFWSLTLSAALAATLTAGVLSAAARNPKSDDNAATSRGGRGNDQPRSAANRRQADPPPRESAARERAPARSIAPAARESSGPAATYHRTPAAESRRAIGAEPRQSDTSRSGADARQERSRRTETQGSAPAARSRTEGGSATPAPEPRARTIRSEGSSTPPAASTGTRGDSTGGQGVSDVRKRLGGAPPADSTSKQNRDASSGVRKYPSSGRESVPGVSNPEGKQTAGSKRESGTPPSQDRSGPGISDVRKRLGGHEPRPGGEPGADRTKIDRGTLPGRGKLPADPGHVREGAKTPPHIGNLPKGTLPPARSKAEVRELASQRFPDRWKGGQLDGVVKGASAQHVKLADQYKMAQKGDVARRLQLEKHGAHPVNLNLNINVNRYVHHPDHYHGYVGPAYLHHSFEHHYWGPRFFVGVCWYPTWSPWVSWSWRYHCHPIWDPRPYWCRPIIYEPCPVWVYYQPVVWQPLPEVACGTWVDVQPVAVPAQDYNLQLLAVRFVDPGHPEEKQGPRYRIWFRNNSSQPVTQPFNVVLMASNDGRLAPGLPQTGARVTSIEAGDTQSIDLRLPNDVYTMGRDAQGKPAPYGTVHVNVDAHREIPQSNRANNGVNVAVTEVLPVDPAAFELDPRTAVPGGEILLAGEGFGPEAGRALVNVNGQELDAEILGWYDLGVRVKLPNVAVAGPTPAEVIIIRGDSAAANPLKITLAPGQVSAMPPPALPQ